MRTGRPRAENPKNLNVTVRFDAPTFKELEAYCEEKQQSKADATRDGVRLLLDTEKKRKEEKRVRFSETTMENQGADIDES